ncbi:eCIS core domain-containing protein [Aquimarina sp. M1]
MFKTATAHTTNAKSSNSSLFQKEKGDGAFIQPKLNIGKPGDKYEVEADKVADTIVSKGNDQSNSFFSPAPVVQKQSEEEVQKQENNENQVQQKSLIEHISPLVQRQPEEEPVQQKEEEEIQKQPEEEVKHKEAVAETTIQEKTDSTPITSDIQKQEEEIQEKEEEEEEVQPIQTKINTAVSSGGVENSSIESRLNSSKGGGSPLPKDTKSQMESGFGTDFSNVRVHTDSNAKQMSQDMGAQAFAHGNDIYFNEGKFDTSSNSGKHLLAHELTHTVQQGGGIKRKAADVTSAPIMIQGSFLDWIPDWIINNARHIPGYILFTVIIQYDPLLGQRVEPTPINLLQGLMGLVPFGTAIFDKLQEYGIIQQVFDWVNGQLSSLNLTSQGLLDLVEEAWDELEFPYTNAIEVITRKFNQLISRIELFAISLVDQIITWIKEALIGVAEPILEENRAWSLIKKIIHYDPLRDEEVTATTVEILEDFLILIGKETELEQMRERGTLQETADWLDTQVGTFMSLLGELRGLITAAWDAIRPANLTEIAANLTALSGRVTGFLERVWAFAATVAIEVLKIIKKALLSWLSSVANETRGFSLIKVIIGKDPFTDEAVPRTVPNLIRGFMSLMDGGEEQYAQMVETGAIARITGEIEAAVERLNMTPQSIVQLFIDLWNSFTIEDLLNPIDAFIRIIDQFGQPIGRLIAFVAEIVRIVIVAILEIMNFPFDLIGNIITRSLQAMEDIKRDPIGFLKNILRAIKEGFVKFFDNIVTHLINGVMGWLMRELRDAGIPELTDFSLQGVISWVLEVLGLSMERIWEKLAEHPRIGPERVARIRGAINTLEGIWTFIKDVQERGIAAIWDKIQEQLSNLWNVVIDAVKNFVMTRIITQITTRLLSMLDPTGIMAVINGAMAFFNAVQSFIQYLREMLEVINSFVNGVADIAQGNVATAADYLERTMGQSMPVVIGFLANQVGLGGIGSRIAEIIGSVRALIDEALTWLVNKAVDTGMALLDRVMGRSAPSSEEETPTGPVGEALAEITSESGREKDEGEVTAEEAQGIKNKVNTDHASVINISSVTDGGDTWNYNYVQREVQEEPKKVVTPPVELPTFDNGLGRSFFAKYITNDPSHTPPGEDASQNNGQTLKGWRNLQNFIVSGGKTIKDKNDNLVKVDASVREIGNYVKMHLLHDRLGGRATDSNLVPAKSSINTAFYNDMESFAVGEANSAPPDNKVLWYRVNVSYHPESPTDGIPNIDYSGYPATVTAEYGHMEYDSASNSWSEGAASPHSFGNSDIKIPDFGKAEDREFYPNTEGWNILMAMEDFDVFPDFHISETMARFINNERSQRGNFTSYNGPEPDSFVNRMNTRKEGRPRARVTVPSDYAQSMQLINSLHGKGRFII